VVKRAPQKNGYMPTLDGWRAIAILSVIFFHDSYHSLGPFNTGWFYGYGKLGVDVFFAISGVLICSRLLDEERIHGRIQLKDFYIRRGFRILPPVFIYLGVLAILSAFSVVPVTRGEFAECLLFCRNISHFLGNTSLRNTPVYPASFTWQRWYYTGHFWSLSLEEQFYLLLPASLALLAGRYRARAIGAIAVAVAVHRALSMQIRPWVDIMFHSDIRIDALLVPAMMAILAWSPQNRPAFQKYLRFWPLGVIAFLCIVPYGQETAWGQTVFVWLLPAIVLGSVLNPANVFGRFLEWSVLRYIGRISYSLYLWQQLFFTGHFEGGSHSLGWLQNWPLRLIITFLLAAISYHLIECPLIKLGYKLAPPSTAGRQPMEAAEGEHSQHSLLVSPSALQTGTSSNL
jgi:peptidoglycan/LPS O-acetylase OafA/YrhL